jgi:hypothetical protein
LKPKLGNVEKNFPNIAENTGVGGDWEVSKHFFDAKPKGQK